MRRTLNFSRVVMTVCLCIAGKLLSASNLSDRNNKFTEKKLNMIQEWDKTFPENDKVRHSKVTFHVMVLRLLLTCISPKMQKVNCRQSLLAGRLVR